MLLFVRRLPHYQPQRLIIGTWRESSSSSSCVATNKRCFSIGRMLDMGGMPSAANDQSPIRAVNASKNCKLQAVAFDFDVLTKSFEEKPATTTTTTTNAATTSKKLGAVQPDLDHIQHVASLLQVDVDTGKGKETTQKKQKTTTATPNLPNQDIRAKYASKLKGGLAGLELAKSQVQDTLKGGDAAGHLAARQKAIHETAASPTKWMALTGTGKLLSYLTHRSIRIALLPNPRYHSDVQAQKQQHDSMKQFTKQLKDVVVDTIVEWKNNSNDNGDTVSSSISTLETGVLKRFDAIHPNQVLIVSDRDDYLKAARELGMMTCRIRPLNARRGNVTTNYSAPSIPEVQEVINEINGISFNAVLNR